MKPAELLYDFGLNNREVEVFLALVQIGPSSIRTLANKSGINRGSTYECLKKLISLGIVSIFDKNKRKFYVAEQPDRLIEILDEKEKKFQAVRLKIDENLEILKKLYFQYNNKPVVKMFEGLNGIKTILKDVLKVVSLTDEKVYYVYSSATVRNNVHQSMPNFSQHRIRLGIKVKTIALGSGGQLVGLDERKWLNLADDMKSTYEIIYSNKVAHISLDEQKEPIGIVIESTPIYQTQKMIFESNWKHL
jgi:sugar-specific transcriptional regulator TrmB